IDALDSRSRRRKIEDRDPHARCTPTERSSRVGRNQQMNVRIREVARISTHLLNADLANGGPRLRLGGIRAMAPSPLDTETEIHASDVNRVRPGFDSKIDRKMGDSRASSSRTRNI